MMPPSRAKSGLNMLLSYDDEIFFKNYERENYLMVNLETGFGAGMNFEPWKNIHRRLEPLKRE